MDECKINYFIASSEFMCQVIEALLWQKVHPNAMLLHIKNQGQVVRIIHRNGITISQYNYWGDSSPPAPASAGPVLESPSEADVLSAVKIFLSLNDK